MQYTKEHNGYYFNYFAPFASSTKISRKKIEKCGVGANKKSLTIYYQLYKYPIL